MENSTATRREPAIANPMDSWSVIIGLGQSCEVLTVLLPAVTLCLAVLKV